MPTAARRRARTEQAPAIAVLDTHGDRPRGHGALIVVRDVCTENEDYAAWLIAATSAPERPN